MTEFTPELIEKARAAESAEALLALAKENGMEDFTEESAQSYFELLHPATGAVSDEELENVSGGGCYNKGELVVTNYTKACKDGYVCKDCQRRYKNLQIIEWGVYTMHQCATKGYEITNWCNSCYYLKYKRGLYLCTNPEKRK